MDDRREITDLLRAWPKADAVDRNRLMTLVYDELRAIAHNRRLGERVDHTLTTTALVHEAFLKLVDLTRIEFRDQAHFFAVAAGAMRRILVDYARRYNAAKRGRGMRRVDLDEVTVAIEDRADTLIAVDRVLDRLSAVDRRLALVVECRYFGGLSDEETATALNVSVRTVRRDWTKAKGWLHQELTA